MEIEEIDDTYFCQAPLTPSPFVHLLLISYQVDDISPSRCLPQEQSQKIPYEILSKSLVDSEHDYLSKC